jgi:hypothetical protein
MRLYADEDFPLPVVEELRRCGHDVLTVQEDKGPTTAASCLPLKITIIKPWVLG